MKPAEVARYWEANAETWTRHARAGYDIYRDGLNTPAFLDSRGLTRGERGGIGGQPPEPVDHGRELLLEEGPAPDPGRSRC